MPRSATTPDPGALTHSGVPSSSPSRPGADPSRPDADPFRLGADPSQPGAGPSRPGADPSCPGADPSRPGADPGGRPPGGGRAGLADRIARAAVTAAARRWPADIADAMCQEWLAELAAMGRSGAYRKMAFAGSLLLSPAVDEPGWRDRAATLGRTAPVAAGLTLLAAALVNAVRAAGALAPLQLTVAVAACLAIGLRVRVPAVPIGGAVFVFLLAGNAVPVMPFTGFVDIVPAVLTWTALTAVVARYTARLAAAGRRRRAALLAVGGGAVALDLATIAGSAHAAALLGIPAASAAAWFPLALVPGGVPGFGPSVPADPTLHASDVLLANATVVAGPLLLCTVAVLASAFRHRGAPEASPASLRAGGRQLMAGIAAALGGLALCEVLVHSTAAAEVTLHRMLTNSAVFDFGFLTHPAGRGAVALLTAVLVMRAVEALPTRRAQL